jgi:hypothetical protein
VNTSTKAMEERRENNKRRIHDRIRELQELLHASEQFVDTEVRDRKKTEELLQEITADNGQLWAIKTEHTRIGKLIPSASEGLSAIIEIKNH